MVPHAQVHQELLGEYYHASLGVDYRSLRLPGVVSSKTMPVRSWQRMS